jgi:hypothetical protein
MTRTKTFACLKDKGIDDKNTAQMVESINNAGIKNTASDAKNLLQWMDSAKSVL